MCATRPASLPFHVHAPPQAPDPLHCLIHLCCSVVGCRLRWWASLHSRPSCKGAGQAVQNMYGNGYGRG